MCDKGECSCKDEMKRFCVIFVVREDPVPVATGETKEKHVIINAKNALEARSIFDNQVRIASSLINLPYFVSVTGIYEEV